MESSSIRTPVVLPLSSVSDWKHSGTSAFLSAVSLTPIDTISSIDDWVCEWNIETCDWDASCQRFIGAIADLFWWVVDGAVPVDAALETIAVAVKSRNETLHSGRDSNIRESSNVHSDPAFSSAIADVVWMIGLAVDHRRGDKLEENRESSSRLRLLVASLVSNNVLSHRLLKERCEIETLGSQCLRLGDESAISKSINKTRTRMLYTQNKFNLMREESEGYAKLVVALNTFHDRVGDAATSFTTLRDRVESLIGYFDLDPNRVLDIVLDSFGCDLNSDILLSVMDMFQPSSLPHILGFKFQAAAESHALIQSSFNKDMSIDAGEDLSNCRGFVNIEEASRVVKDSLSLASLAAALLASGKLTVSSFFPHLSPSDTVLYDDFKVKAIIVTQDARSFGTVRLGGGDDADKDTEDNTFTVSDTDLRFGVAYLSIRDVLYPRKGLLAPLQQQFDVIVALLNRAASLVTKTASPLHEEKQTLACALEMLHRVSGIDPAADGLVRGAIGQVIDAFIGRAAGSGSACCLSVGLPNSFVSTVGDINSRWNSSALLSLVDYAFPLLLLLGFHLADDLIRLSRVCRTLIGFCRCVEDSGAQSVISVCKVSYLNESALDIVAKTILPALSCCPGNAGIVSEVWSVICLLPSSVRCGLYREWLASYDTHPLLLKVKMAAAAATKKALKRLSKDNLKQYGRELSKVCHANPIPSLLEVLHNVQAYDNLVAIFVEALKYITPLSQDVLCFCVIETLSSEEKADRKLKGDGTNVAAWLQSLAVFTGCMLRRYAAMDIGALLLYVADQLKSGNSSDLLVLQEIVSRMTGIESLEDISQANLEALAGGFVLRQEVMTILQGTSSSLSVGVTPGGGSHISGMGSITLRNKRSSARLQKALLLSHLASPLLILLAQQKETIVYGGATIGTGDDESAPIPLKSIADQLDKCHDTFLQFAEFIALHITPASEYASLLPPFPDLVEKYHLPPEVAFHIFRPVLLPVTVTASNNNSEVMLNERDVINAINLFWPSYLRGSVSANIHRAFYCLSLYDVFVPEDQYQYYISQCKSQLAEKSNSNPGQFADLTGSQLRQFKIDREKEIKRLESTVEKLKQELVNQQNNCKMVLKFLKSDSLIWFGTESTSLSPKLFIQNCVLPRVAISAADALYTFKFIELMHALNTPNWNTLVFLDSLIESLPAVVFKCTEKEASRFGRFLCEILRMVATWKKSEKHFKEFRHLRGFLINDTDVITFTALCARSYVWHKNITGCVVKLLESREYMDIRTSLIVLSKLEPVFPVTVSLVNEVQRRVEKIRLHDKRDDLKVMATRYSAMLKKNQNVVDDNDFAMSVIVAVKNTVKSNLVTNVPVDNKAKTLSSLKKSDNQVNRRLVEPPHDSRDSKSLNRDKRPIVSGRDVRDSSTREFDRDYNHSKDQSHSRGRDSRPIDSLAISKHRMSDSKEFTYDSASKGNGHEIMKPPERSPHRDSKERERETSSRRSVDNNYVDVSSNPVRGFIGRGSDGSVERIGGKGGDRYSEKSLERGGVKGDKINDRLTDRDRNIDKNINFRESDRTTVVSKQDKSAGLLSKPSTVSQKSKPSDALLSTDDTTRRYEGGRDRINDSSNKRRRSLSPEDVRHANMSQRLSSGKQESSTMKDNTDRSSRHIDDGNDRDSRDVARTSARAPAPRSQINSTYGSSNAPSSNYPNNSNAGHSSKGLPSSSSQDPQSQKRLRR